MHDSKSLDTGEEVILTLADSNVLDIDGTTGKIRGINDDDDVLENVNIAADERRLHAQKEILRSKRPLYSGTYSLTHSLTHLLTRSLTHSLAFLGIDDDEFEENDGSFTIGKKSAILSYYDPLKKKGPALVLDDTGIVAGSNKSNGNEFNYTDNESLVVGGPQRKPQSLQVTKSESSDYYNKVRTHLPRSHSLTHSPLTHSLTHSVTLTYSLTHSLRKSITHFLINQKKKRKKGK